MTGSSQQSSEGRHSDSHEITLPQKKAVAKNRGDGNSGALTVVEVDRRHSSGAGDEDEDDDDEDDEVDNDVDDATSSDSTSDIDNGACCPEVRLLHLINMTDL